MTLLFFDGFDIYETADDAVMASSMAAGMWGDADGIEQETEVANVRTGRGAMRMRTNTHNVATKVLASTSVLVFGVGYKPTDGGNNVNIAGFQHVTASTAFDMIHVGWDSQHRLTIWRASDSAVVARSSANAITFNTYQYIEVKAIGGVSTGEVVARINEIEVARASGLDLSRNNQTMFNRFGLRVLNEGNNEHYFDDFYLLNGDGAVNNDFLGQVEIQTHHVEANGDQNDFAVVGTSVNWDAVDEQVSDADVTYVHSSTVGHKDLFKASSLTAGVTDVFAVMPVIKVRKETAGSNSIFLLTRVSGVEASSTLKTPDTNYQFFNHVFETQPAGGDWTVAAVSALQIGLSIVSTT